MALAYTMESKGGSMDNAAAQLGAHLMEAETIADGLKAKSMKHRGRRPRRRACGHGARGRGIANKQPGAHAESRARGSGVGIAACSIRLSRGSLTQVRPSDILPIFPE